MKHSKQLALFLIVLFPICGFASEPKESSIGSLDDIAKSIATYFPKVSGTITSVHQGEVVIKSENEAGLSDGIFISVYREKEQFYHPVTHAALGHFEEEVATLEVVSVAPSEITGRPVESGNSSGEGELLEEKATSTIAIGDLVRLTAARIPIGIRAGETDKERFLIDEFGSALEETGRFSVKPLPPNAMLEDPNSKENLYFITLSAGVLPGPFSLQVRMQNVKTGKTIFDVASILQELNGSDSIFESLQYQLFEKQQKGMTAK